MYGTGPDLPLIATVYGLEPARRDGGVLAQPAGGLDRRGSRTEEHASIPADAAERHDFDSELLYCTKCGETGTLKREKFLYTSAYVYQQYRCTACEGLSRGKRSKDTTELRSV